MNKKYLTIPLVCISTLILNGCVVAALAPLAGLANGSRENKITANVDENSFTPAVRNAFIHAKTLGVVAGDPSAIRAADLFETRGGYTVNLDRVTAKTGEMLGSERRDALGKLCKVKGTDLALLGYVSKTSSGNGLMGAVTGRAEMNQTWIMDMLVCKSKTALSFGGSLMFDGGIMNQKTSAEFAEMTGAELGSKILAAIGK